MSKNHSGEITGSLAHRTAPQRPSESARPKSPHNHTVPERKCSQVGVVTRRVRGPRPAARRAPRSRAPPRAVRAGPVQLHLLEAHYARSYFTPLRSFRDELRSGKVSCAVLAHRALTRVSLLHFALEFESDIDYSSHSQIVIGALDKEKPALPCI
ncbi:hypothetical protein EVAR_96969_1 [Eumeta japonica]|uniref:Uncharacterized protein n=1 Tax=Eumeta variegata TaxID=151549 RepID=A0A4C1VDT7_EUMVA|nr:hypothetical protein EVAR_96969_1 [Eumeta japonica]